MPEDLVHSQTYVLDDLPEKYGRDITPGMKGNGGTAPVRMPELHVGPTLTHAYKAHHFQYPDNLTGFEYGNIAHNYATTTF